MITGEKRMSNLWIPVTGFGQDPCSALVARLGDPPVVSPTQFASVPVAVTTRYLRQLTELGQVLDKALRAIVMRYFDDKKIRDIYGLSEELVSILRLTHDCGNDTPYRIGFYRPDFVYDLDGRPRICEIGARYPLNGWMISLLVAQVYGSYAAQIGLAAQTMQSAFVDYLCELHPARSAVAMVHAREAGTEIFLLADLLRKKEVKFLPVHPGNLSVRGGQLYAGDQAVDRCILEMDRTELPLLPVEVLKHLIGTGSYFNDVRTLILVHDKRVLAVLWDEAIMRDLLAPDDLSLLRSFLIPSWTIATGDDCEALLARPEDMIAKRSSGGRGIDTVVRSVCGETAWRQRVLSQWARDMYQPYLAQRVFHSPDDGAPIRLVGMQLCRDSVSYGAGVFRGSRATIINVHGNRGRVFAALQVP